MSLRRFTATIGAAAAAALTLTACSADDLFSNLNGTRSANSPRPSPADSQPPAADAPPNYADNNRARQPKDISSADRQAAARLAKDIERALERTRDQRQVTPAQVRPVLEDLVGARRLDVSDRTIGLEPKRQTDGSFFGVFVGDTACVNGAVSSNRVWVNVSGHYPETGCLEPPFAH
jgi:hypothetical protein